MTIGILPRNQFAVSSFMARSSLVLIEALRTTALRLAAGSAYQWGHHGQCNCGHLAQTVCKLPPARIHQFALERDGDWEALCNAYCPTSGYPIDDVISELCALGLTPQDLANLEKLDAPEVLAACPVVIAGCAATRAKISSRTSRRGRTCSSSSSRASPSPRS